MITFITTLCVGQLGCISGGLRCISGGLRCIARGLRCISFVFYIHTDREETQRAALRLYKAQGDDIGIPFKLDTKRLKVLRDYRFKQSENVPRKKQRRNGKGNESGDEFKEINLDNDPRYSNTTHSTQQSNHSNTNHSNTSTHSSTNSNSRTNKNKKALQFRFNEKYRTALVTKCVAVNIMSLTVRFRDKMFAKIWQELILEDDKWALASLQRVKDEYYSKQNEVLKLVKNGKEYQIVRESNKKLLKYVKEQDLLTETMHLGDDFSLASLYIFFNCEYCLFKPGGLF